MKKWTICAVLAFAPLAVAALDSEAMAKLKDTGSCENCDLTGADLRWAAVFAAELGGAPNLVNGNLQGADLTGANLYGANLEGTKMQNATLIGANLSWSSMIGANLTGADITNAKTQGAIFCRTIMPDGTRNDANC